MTNRGDASDTRATAPDEIMIHAACVALNGRAVLITGASGSGKSALALQLMAFGCDLVADDRTVVRALDGKLMARPAEAIRGLIEARGVGILRAQPCDTAQVTLVIDLDRDERDRLPHPHETVLLGQALPLLLGLQAPYFAAAVLQYMRHGRSA